MSPSSTRRAFLASSAALPFAVRGLAAPSSATRDARWVFLGTDQGAGIYRCSWDASTGRLGMPQLAAKTDRPDFLALHPKLHRLYAVNAVGGAGGGASSFRLDRTTGKLEFGEHQSSRGDGACFVSVDATGRCAFVANYSAGSFAAFELSSEGALLPATGTLNCKGTTVCGTQGPNHERQDASHLHSATLSPGNDFVLACDLGNDSIEVFAIQPEAANPLGKAQRVAARAGSGPRHVAFHPNGRWLYVIHELDCTLELYEWSVTAGKASLQRKEHTAVSTLATNTGLTGNTASEVLVSTDGRFVYAATRGVDELALYSIDAHTGMLTEQQRLPCGGKIPRHITFDPTGRWLLSANQNVPGNVTVFARDAATGHLSGPVQTLAADTPMFVLFV